MAKAKTVYSSKEEIPEGLEDYYTERDGTFRFNANDYETDEEIQGLRKALREERDTVSELQNQLKGLPDDFDAEKWDALKHIDPDDVNSKGDEALLKQIDSLKEQVSSLKDKVKAKESEVEEIGNQYKNTIARSKVQSALAAAGVTDEILLETATDRVMSKQRVNTVEEEDVLAVKIGDLDKAPEEWAKGWVETDEGKRFATAPENYGGGSRNNGKVDSIDGDNPFDMENPNRTRQQAIMNKDRKKAKKMAQLAGWPDDKMKRVFNE